jgi:hypothetical protein
MALGPKEEDDEINLCLYCHRQGLTQRRRLEIEKNGQILTVWDACPKKDTSGPPQAEYLGNLANFENGSLGFKSRMRRRR